MEAIIKLNGKRIEVKNIEKCTNLWQQTRGLMLRKQEEAPNLLFEFNNEGRTSIHSIFCPLFLALWLDENNKITEYKLVKPFKVNIKPCKNARKLLEIPLNSRNSKITNFIVGNIDVK